MRKLIGLVVAGVALSLLALALERAVPAGATGSSTQTSTGKYSAPVWFPLRSSGGNDIVVGCTYHSTDTQVCNGYHPWWALDLGAQVGSPVYAAGAGQVYAVATGQTGCSSTANWVMVDHHGNYSTYYHLDTVKVAKGDWVDQTTQLGTVGETGLANRGCWPHLHYEKDSTGTASTQSSAVDPGGLQACYGNVLKTFPDAWGLSTWEGIPWGTRKLHSDGTVCDGADPASFAGHIVQATTDTATPKTSWFVTPDLKRELIPDTNAYTCVKALPSPGPDSVSSAMLSQLPDQTGQWVACGDTMPANRTLQRDMYMKSGDGRYTLWLQHDGNLVLYGPSGRALWATYKYATVFVIFQSDGNLVGYSATGAPTWWSGTDGRGGLYFAVQSDGNLVIYSASKALWNSKTSGLS